MPAPHKSKPRGAWTSHPAGASPASTDATRLLIADHQELLQLFATYEALAASQAVDEVRQDLALRICTLLAVHAAIEEEILYPAARDALGEDALIDNASVEHATAQDLVRQIEGMEPADDLYDAKVRVLGCYIAHHIREEEKALFPKLRKSGLKLKDLGHELQLRKQQLMNRLLPQAQTVHLTH